MKPVWPVLLGPLSVWAAHFFIVYGIGEFWGDGTAQRIVVVAATLVCLALLGWIARLVAAPAATGGFERWRRTVGLSGAALSAVAVAWQVLPALI